MLAALTLRGRRDNAVDAGQAGRLTIGRIAAQASTTAKALRYCDEREGLMHPATKGVNVNGVYPRAAVLAVFFALVCALADRLAALSRRIPRWTGALFIVLGLWSIWFGLFVSLRA